MTPVQQSTAQSSTSWRNIGLAILASLIASFQIGKAIIALPLLQGAPLHLSLQQTGLVLSALAIVGAGLAMPLGYLVSRFEPRKVLCTGLATIALASLVGALAPYFAVLIATRVFEGVAVVSILVCASSLIGRLALPADRDLAMAISSTAVPGGIALVMLAATSASALGHQISWPMLWLANAVLAVVVIGLLLALLPRMPAAVPMPAPAHTIRSQAGAVSLNTRGSGHIFRNLLGEAFSVAQKVATSSGPLLIALSFTLYAIIYFAFSGFLPLLLRDLLGLSITQAGFVSAGVVASNVVGNIFAGALMRRGIAPGRVVLGGFVVAVICAPILFWLHVPTAAAIALACTMIGGMGCIPGALTAIAPKKAPDPSLIAPTIGLMFQGSYVGQLVGPLTAGALAQAGGWSLVAWMLLPLAVVGALVARKL